MRGDYTKTSVKMKKLLYYYIIILIAHTETEYTYKNFPGIYSTFLVFL